MVHLMKKLIMALAILFIPGVFMKPAFSGNEAAPEVLDIQKTLYSRYPDLLIEKGLCDARGQEIDGRVKKLIDKARARGVRGDDSILSFILSELNYAPTNLGGFPPCAFDRPIGHKLDWFGRTISPGNIDADAEGSACPVGGIGAGGYEWTMSGNFRYWFLKLGWMVDDTVWANQFHVYVKQGKKKFAQTLSVDTPPSGILSSWRWGYPAGKGSYYALFPKSGFSYERNDDFPVKLAVVQFSPVIPHNYRETSYPVAVYKWIAENPSDEPIEISIMLTWQNMVGWEPVARPGRADFAWDRKSAGNVNTFVAQGSKKGILFIRQNVDLKTGNALTGSMSIAAAEVPGKTIVSYHVDFNPDGDGSEVWTPFSTTGTLSNSIASRTASAGDSLAGALAVKVKLESRERMEIPIVVAWDFPYYEFERGIRYRKKYTEFFGATGDRAFAMAGEALDKYREWEKAIDAGQKTILDNPRFPGWLKQALLNELYVLSETSIWDASTDLHTYLESVDYLMYGTFDVDSYCWSILKLWPELEMRNIRFFARTVELEDPAFKQYQYPIVFPEEVPKEKMDYYWNANKVYGMIPHDLGSPRHRPWVILNAFDWQNGNVWKDLNPKFPLRAYRDFLATGAQDYDFVAEAFRASVIALNTLERRFADPQTHVPLNEGIPDQTYDTWRMTGESAYITVLWLAALKATWTMGEKLLEQGGGELNPERIKETIVRYRSWFEKGKRALDKLWDEDGGYFHIDAKTDDIMADQLFGLWYSAMLGHETEETERIISESRARRALRTIFEKNVLGFGRGLMGAVNGRRRDGSQLFSQQGDEVWVGTSYALAANLALHGLEEEALHTAYGVYYTVYGPFGHGYFFKTPEAYCNPEERQWNNPSAKYGDRVFRAMKYMRPGSVWALAEVLDRSVKVKK